MFCPVEVKRTDNSWDEAVLQLAVWQSSHFAFMTSKGSLPSPLALQIGFVVFGETWKVYICQSISSSQGDEVKLWEQIPVRVGLGDFDRALKLLAVLRATLRWAAETHVPAFEQLLSQNATDARYA